MSEKLLIEIDNHIAKLIINNPPANTWDQESLSFLKKSIEELNDNKEIFSLTKSTLYNSKSLTLIIIGSIFLHIPLGAGNFEVLWAVNEREFTSSEYNSLFGIFFIELRPSLIYISILLLA